MKKTFTLEDVTKIVNILTGNVDYKKIVVDLARSNPEVLLYAEGEKGAAGIALSFMRDNHPCNKISTIKHVRFETGMGLKEAKELIEEVAERHNISFATWQ